MPRFNNQAIIGALAVVLLSACSHPMSPSSISTAETNSVVAAGGYTKEAIARIIRQELETSSSTGSVRLAPEIRIERLPTKYWYSFECDYFVDSPINPLGVRYFAKGICYMSIKTVKLTSLKPY